MESYGLSFLGCFFHKIIWYIACHFFTGPIHKVIIYFDSLIGYVVALTVVNFFDKHCMYDSFSPHYLYDVYDFCPKSKKLELVASFISTDVNNRGRL